MGNQVVVATLLPIILAAMDAAVQDKRFAEIAAGILGWGRHTQIVAVVITFAAIIQALTTVRQRKTVTVKQVGVLPA